MGLVVLGPSLMFNTLCIQQQPYGTEIVDMNEYADKMLDLEVQVDLRKHPNDECTKNEKTSFSD